MRFIFDKGMDTEKELEISYYTEHPIEKRLSGSYHILVSAETVFPDLSAFTVNTFSTFEVNSEGVVIPTMGYTTIQNLSTQLIDNEYSVNIQLV